MDLKEIVNIYVDKKDAHKLDLPVFILLNLMYTKSYKEVLQYGNTVDATQFEQWLHTLRFNLFIEGRTGFDIKDYILTSKTSNLFETAKDNITEVIDYLNIKSNSKFRATTARTRSLVSARLIEYTVDEIKTVISYKCREWLSTEWQMYLRPTTLFNEGKFESYFNQAIKHQDSDKIDTHDRM